jgi:hypothetical protein
MIDFGKFLIPVCRQAGPALLQEKGVDLRYDEAFGNFIPFNPKCG